MDAIAARMNIDRIEIRRRNLIAAHEMPYTRPMSTLNTEIVLDSGDYHSLLDKTLAHIGWDAFKNARWSARRAGCAARRSDLGIAYFVEKTESLGPS